MNTSKIFADERKQMIVALLNRDMKKSVSELCEEFSVSPATMRADLRDLEAEGLLKRTHGGAMSNKKMSFEPTSNETKVANVNKKSEIARKAADLVSDNDVVILDTGSTILELAKHLADKKNLTVITYDFQIASYLEQHSEANVFFLGGQLRRNFHCAIGPMALGALQNVNADRAFLGANGVSLSKGLSTPNIEIAMIKKEMIRVSDEVIVLCDSTKFERTSFSKFAELKDMDLIITDGDVDREWLTTYRNAGVVLETPVSA